MIHTVGPVYKGKEEDSKYLTNCYQNSLRLAVENNIHSIAFPAISCGVYGYPIEDASRIAIDTTCDFLKTHKSIKKVVFILFSTEDQRIYTDYLSEIA